MANTVKSARGVTVDFDLLKIKQQMASAPKTTVVQAREDFIDKKFSRKVSRLNKQVGSKIDVSPTGKVKEPKVTDEPAIEPIVDIVDDVMEDQLDQDFDPDMDPMFEEPQVKAPVTRSTRKKSYDNSDT